MKHMHEGRKSISLEKVGRRRWNTKRLANTARDNFGFVSTAHAKQCNDKRDPATLPARRTLRMNMSREGPAASNLSDNVWQSERAPRVHVRDSCGFYCSQKIRKRGVSFEPHRLCSQSRLNYGHTL